MDDKLPTGEGVAQIGVDVLVVKSVVGIVAGIQVTSIKAVRVPTR